MSTYTDLLATIDFLLLMASPNAKVAEKVIIADHVFAKPEKRPEEASGPVLYAKYVLGLDKDKIIWVKTPKELQVALQKYQKIDQLHLYFHGAPGTFIFGFGPRPAVVHDIDKLISPPEKLPQLNGVTLVACNVAKEAVKTLTFAQQLKAKQLIGWNHFRVEQAITVPTGTRIKAKKELEDAENYLLEGTPKIADILAKKGTQYIGVEWFREDLNNDRLPPPDIMVSRQKIFKPQKSARPVTIKTMEEAEEYQREQRNPVNSLDKVIFEIAE